MQENRPKLFLNGHFFLGGQQWAKAVLADEQGIITQISHNPSEFAGKPFSIVDCKGVFVFPAFEDAHNHPANHSRIFSELDFRDQEIGWEEAKKNIRQKTEATKSGQWIVCHGYNEAVWGILKKEDLDEASKEHGILLANVSYHGGVVNSKGIELLRKQGFRGERTTLEQGRIRESTFEEALALTAPEAGTYVENIQQFHQRLFSLGIGAVHDIEIGRFAPLEAYAELDRQGLLRMPSELYVSPEVLEKPKRLRALLASYKTARVHGIKLVLDGAIGTSTAALSNPYVDGTGTGELLISFEECEAAIRKAAEFGLQDVAMHCIGDRAIRFGVNLFKKLQPKYRSAIKNWRFEHFEMPSNEATQALAERRGIACMQPNFSWDVENYKERLGEARKKINPFRQILDAGVQLAFGSDDMPSGPLEGIAWATAKTPSLHQRISVKEAMRAYTETPAAIVGAKRGKIAKGCEANFAVFEKNPFQVSLDEIENLAVKQTWVRGEKVFG